MKTLAVAVLALVVAVGSVLFPKTTTTVVESLGSGSGQDHYAMEFFHGGLADGGEVLATSTAGNSTLKAVDFMKVKQVDMTLTGGAGTLTLPASSTLAGWLPNAGDSRTILVRNASTSVNALLTVAVGTGMTLKNAASSTALLVGDTDGDNTMFVTVVRKLDKDFNVFLQKYED